MTGRCVIATDKEENVEEGQPAEEPRGFSTALKKGVNEIGVFFTSILSVPRAHWGLNISYFLEGAAYFGILTELMLYFKENMLVSQHHASIIVGFFTCGITLSQLFLGGVADRIGVRRALWLAMGLLVTGRVLLSLGGTLPGGTGLGSWMFFMTIGALLIVAVGYGMYQPAAYAAVRQFTDKKGAAIGYAMIYGLMNLGSFAIGWASPEIREASVETFPPNGLTAVFWACTGAVVVGLLVVLTMMTRRNVEAATRTVREADHAEPAQAAPSRSPATRLWDVPFVALALVALAGLVFLVDYIIDQPLETVFAFATSGNPSIDLPVRIGAFLLLLAPVMVVFLIRRPDHPFRNSRFVFFIFILIPVQTLFAHNWLTLPTYIKYGFSGFVSDKYEFISNINPLLIFVLAPVVAALTARVNVYRMMILGTLIMAAPTFLLALGTEPAWLYAYIILMTIGEAMWQPRFLQYIAEIAPEGQTGIYMGIGQFPWFLTKMITGFYAGWFLARYCPENGPQSTQTMWLIYGLIAMITPAALWLVRRWAGAGKGMGTPKAA